MDPRAEHLNNALAGRYRIDRELGAGGMATVYLAEDAKHGRRVAIKVLRDDLAASVGAARFLREIEIAARLQHPHILGLIDSGDAGGVLYYVMPFVEGESLRHRLDRDHELSTGDAVRLLTEIADALAYAHAQGVVHRDIKPDNVMMSGRHALVMDFGVARAVTEAAGEARVTQTGIALGTPAYMAPEQAMGEPNIDHRVDLYAFGVLAYELLAGQPPFAGRSAQQVIAAHLTETPESIARHRSNMPAALDQIVMKCLAKRPADRWQNASELVAALERLVTPGGGTMVTSALPPSVLSNKRRLLVGAVALAVVAAAWLVPRAMRRAGADNSALTIDHPSQLTNDDGLEIHPAISPDGKFVAFAAGNSIRMRVFIRPVAGGRTVPLSDDSTTVETEPRWSADGSRLLFMSRGGLRIAPTLGGESRLFADGLPDRPIQSADWATTGDIAFVRGDSLYVQPLDSARPRALAAGSDLHSCRWSPDAKWIACVRGNSRAVRPGPTFANLAPAAIVNIDASTGAVQQLTTGSASNGCPTWLGDSRRLLFVSDRDVYSLAITPQGARRGEPLRMTTGLNAHSISLATATNRVAYSVYTERSNLWSIPMSSNAALATPAARQLTTGNQVIEAMSISADRRWLLYDATIGGRAELYRMPLAGGQVEQLTNDGGMNFRPSLSPDGKELAFHSWRSGNRDLFVQRLDGGPPQQITSTPTHEAGPIWSPDGRSLAFEELEGSNGLFVTTRDATGHWSKPRRLATTNPASVAWSRDGRQLAFVNDDRIRVVPSDSGAEETRYEARGDAAKPEQVFWNADGTGFYFKSHDAQGRASFWSVGANGAGLRQRAFLDDPSRPSNRYDFATDGKSFIFPVQDRQSDVWIAELLRK